MARTRAARLSSVARLTERLRRCRELTAEADEVSVAPYAGEAQLAAVVRLIAADLSEPYSVYTYRYFVHKWPRLCLLAWVGGRCVGAVVCKQDAAVRARRTRGYIAMLAVERRHRRLRIGSRLVSCAIDLMRRGGCDEVCLETETANEAALRLYERLGFVRERRLFRYYLNGADAFRLKLYFSAPAVDAPLDLNCYDLFDQH